MCDSTLDSYCLPGNHPPPLNDFESFLFVPTIFILCPPVSFFFRPFFESLVMFGVAVPLRFQGVFEILDFFFFAEQRLFRTAFSARATCASVPPPLWPQKAASFPPSDFPPPPPLSFPFPPPVFTPFLKFLHA